MKMKNYLSLTTEEKQLLVANLRAMREQLKKDAKRKNVKKKRKSKKKVIKFANPELEKIFHAMPVEHQEEFRDYMMRK